MQLAPGDPLLLQLGTGGTASQSGQTQEDYLVMKRDLKLDKPLLLNFNFFRDYSKPVSIAAHYLAMPKEQIAAEIGETAKDPQNPEFAARLKFLRQLDIPDFNRRLENPEMHDSLARAVEGFVRRWCADMGEYAVPAAMQILQDPQVPLKERIGVIRALSLMVIDPYLYTFPQDPTPSQVESVLSTWRIWWDRNREKFSVVDADTRKMLEEQFLEMSELQSRRELFERLDYFDRDQAPYFAEVLLGDEPMRKKEIAAMLLRKYVGAPLKIDVPIDATSDQVKVVTENWESYYKVHENKYHPTALRRIWNVFADTQYAHMVTRLVTFQFGRSALKTREPVSQKIWDAFLVSAPLMLMAQLVIYFVAVPLGILCAVHRNGWWDRVISVALFLLYSIPPFVAGMLLLLFFCYGDYLKWFPMERLHSDNAGQLRLIPYIIDYLWHAALPVICLSLFQLASMAMYSRSAMLDVISQDYIRTARAKGLPYRRIVWKHALRNSLIPIITLFASFMPALLGGSVLIEQIFGIPGLGRLSLFSILQKDFPTLMALIYIDAIVVMVSILLADILYVLADPRISFEGQGGSA
jgi:peptide/nickel transport system permease protein